MYIRGCEIVSDITVFINDTLVLCTDLIINNLEVDLVASKSDTVNYEVVGCNMIIVLLGIEGKYKDIFGVSFIGDKYVLVTDASSNREATIVICVNIGDWFVPNVHFIQSGRWKENKCEGYWSVGRRLWLGFGGVDALSSLGKITVENFVAGADNGSSIIGDYRVNNGPCGRVKHLVVLRFVGSVGG